MDSTISVCIADDQGLFVSGMMALFQISDEIHVLGTTKNGSDTIRYMMDHAAETDVLILDIGLPDLSGVDVARVLRDASIDTPILIVSNDDSSDTVLRAIRAGICGYLLKDCDGEELKNAVREVSFGRRYIDKRLLPYLMDRVRGEESETVQPIPTNPTRTPTALPTVTRLSPGLEELTPRELEVLRLMAEGHPNDEIANRLFITPKTARNHTTSILQKLGVKTRTQAVVLALSQDISTNTGTLGLFS
ncbi:response regulator [Ferroacidibacillus organovorans]|uniref:DNA-binding response regulator n=1 Tax=Ferroacidibacillus organovorans TaxID=1765683 RepID=A0A1V4EUE8_9BACL|nr:response regulator transcription factor [Ferroacidibacillus organovorans]OPG16394.1 hypothetical protein B2M26_05810 [Ferroacidibacillus organovorans]